MVSSLENTWGVGDDSYIFSLLSYYIMNYVCGYVTYHFSLGVDVSKHLKLILYDHNYDLKMVIIIVFSI